MTHDDVLSELLDEELELAQRLASSPPRTLPLTHSLTPLRKAHRAPAISLKPSTIVLNKLSIAEIESPPSRDESSRSESAFAHSRLYDFYTQFY